MTGAPISPTARQGRSWNARRLAPFGVVLAVAASLALALAARASNIVETPLPAEGRPWQQIPVEFNYDDYARRPGRHIARIQLYLADPSTLIAHEEIHVLLGTYDTLPALSEAWLVIGGTGCVYRMRAGDDFVNNGYHAFVRGPQCTALAGTPTGQAELGVAFDGAGRLGAWGAVPPQPETVPTTIYLGQMQVPVAWRPILHGFYRDTAGPSTLRRLDLLAYVWQTPWGARGISAILGIALVLACTGAAVFPRRMISASRFGAARTGVGAACLAAALGLTYAAVVPPFQAPDEPDHLLSYARATDQPEIARDAPEWARLMHFARIRQPHQRFRTSDVGRPAERPWGAEIAAEDVPVRSGATYVWWTAAARMLRGRPVPETALALRLLNVLLFAVAVGVGCAVVVMGAPNIPYPQMAIFVFLFVPTLPFFAMHVSEYAVLTSLYIILACALVAQFVDGRRAHISGILLGAAVGMLLAGSRSAFPIMPIVAAALGARVLLGPAQAERFRDRAVSALIFWTGTLVAFPTFLLLAGVRYRERLMYIVVDQVPAVAYRLFERGPRAVFGVCAGAAIVAAVTEVLVGTLRERAATPGRAHGTVVRVTAWSTAAVLACTTAASWWMTALPHAGSIEGPGMPPDSPATYGMRVLTTTATMFRLKDPDIYLSSSFWGGFGWLETRLPDAMVVGLTALSAAACLALLIAVGRRCDGRRWTWLVLAAVGAAASLYLYAQYAYAVRSSLHGRYLIGLYVVLLSVFWSPLILGGGRARTDRTPWHAWLLAACGAIHAWTWSFLLARYF